MSDDLKEGARRDDEIDGDAGPGADGDPAGGTRATEIGGRAGPDPTRYGDWEKAGRCIDF